MGVYTPALEHSGPYEMILVSVLYRWPGTHLGETGRGDSQPDLVLWFTLRVGLGG